MDFSIPLLNFEMAGKIFSEKFCRGEEKMLCYSYKDIGCLRIESSLQNELSHSLEKGLMM